MSKKPLLSVVVASHRPNLIEQLLASLHEQTAAQSPMVFEIIIVTDYQNGSLQVQYPTITWLFLSTASISAKRNAGVYLARGSLVAFIDDDCRAAPDWIASGVAYLAAHPQATAVEGHTTIARSHSAKRTTSREYRRLEKPGYRTNNLFFRKAAFLSLGGFDEQFTVQREDMDLAFSALKQGYAIHYCQDVAVEHLFRHGERWDLLKNCWNRRFDPLLYKKHPREYRQHIRTPFPPTLLLLFPAQLLLLALLLFPCHLRRWFRLAATFELLLLAATGLRRTGLHPLCVTTWFFETVQLLVAPLLMLGALVYGSCRYRKLLIV